MSLVVRRNHSEQQAGTAAIVPEGGAGKFHLMSQTKSQNTFQFCLAADRIQARRTHHKDHRIPKIKPNQKHDRRD